MLAAVSLKAQAVMSRFDDRSAHHWLRSTAPERVGRLRPYQRDCILAVEKSLIGGKRDLMVAMATGTGKTFLTVAQIHRLLESKLVHLILVLVDRKARSGPRRFASSALSARPLENKFTQEYEVYSQRFQREDFGDDDPFNPKLLPNEYLTAPAEQHVRLCFHDSADGHEPFRRGGLLHSGVGERVVQTDEHDLFRSQEDRSIMREAWSLRVIGG